MTTIPIAEMLTWYLAFVASTTVHEACHAWVAKLGGDDTASRGGQASLDPNPHMRREPIGMVVLPIISLFLMGWPFGYASAPYDPHWALRYPRRAALMALAGPLGNLALMGVAILAIRIGITAGVFVAPDSAWLTTVAASAAPGIWSGIAALLSVFVSLNLILAVLNLLPLPPLDGSSVVTLLMSEKVAEKWSRHVTSGSFGFFGIFIAWHLFDPLFPPLFLAVVNLIYPGHQYGG
jgi:Zn-dependent protease